MMRIDLQGLCLLIFLMFPHMVWGNTWVDIPAGEFYMGSSVQERQKAMRGTQGNMYPWGNAYDVSKLNNADKGSFATMPVGSFPQGASPFGVLDGAGQVYEWTSTAKGEAYHIVKGGSWDDHGGVCRPAARHSRPNQLKHIIIGFRLVEDINDDAARH